MAIVRWGVLGTARIGRETVIPALQQAPLCRVTALASRNEERARAVARKMHIARAHGSYEALLADPEVDAVYIPLPNHLHVSWTIRALEAGKHVLCEKPIALSTEEAGALQDAARAHPHLKVMEAFMYRFHPQWARARQLIAEGRIGDLRGVHSVFAFYNENPGDIRYDAEMGGGALMDVGCYCLSASRWLFGEEPQHVQATMQNDPRFGVDRLTSGVLAFGEGTATFTCSMQMARHQHLTAYGTEGRLEISAPFGPSPKSDCRLRLHHRRGKEEIIVDGANQYVRQAHRFARAVVEDKPVPTPLSDAVANMRAIDAVRQASR